MENISPKPRQPQGLLCHESTSYLQPRERALSQGIGHLSDLDLVHTLLGSGSRGQPVRHLAAAVLELLEANPEGPPIAELLKVKGMGAAKAILISASIELSRRLYQPVGHRISTPADALKLIRHYADRPQEYFLCLSLNGAHEVLKCDIVTIGLVNRTLVHPREVFSNAIHLRATAVVVAHNHPSGSLEPSLEDREVTKRLKESGEILGIPLLDHVIFSQTDHISFLQRGLL